MISTSARIGTSRGERLSKAIMPDYFQVDERDLSQLINYTLKYAEFVRYFNEKNRLTSDWAGFFHFEKSIFLASIGSTDLEKLEHKKDLLTNKFHNEYGQEQKTLAFREFYHFIADNIIRLDEWYKHSLKINKSPKSSDLELELQGAIEYRLKDYFFIIKKIGNEFLVPLLNTVFQNGFDEYNDHLVEQSRVLVEEKLEEVHFIWKNRNERTEEEKQDDGSARSTSSRSIHRIGETLEDLIKEEKFQKEIQDQAKLLILNYRPIYRVIAYVVQLAPRLLENNLKHNAKHQPHIGLFLSFLRLMEYLQKDINTITKKHLDFYYREILKQKLKKQTADTAPLYFTLVSDVDNFILEKGTLVRLGQDEEGIETVYAIDEMTILNKVVIADLKTIFVSRNSLVGINSSFQVISNIYAAPIANSKDGLGMSFEEGIESSWATLGEDQLEKMPIERTMVNADLGFAIAAPIFKLYEGERMIELNFKFNIRSLSGMVGLIADMGENDPDLSTEDIFYKLFLNAFQVDITGEEGWLRLDKYEVKPPDDWSTGEIRIRFYLPIFLPPIVGHSTEIHGEKYDTELPVLQIYLVSESTIFAYSFFKDLIIESVTINVEVNNVRNIEVYNEYGQIDVNTPFPPFSLQPRVGSYFLVGSGEVFSKELTDIRFNIEWFNLPNEEQSYKDYYDAYNLDIDNDSFKIDVSLLSNFEFQPVEKSSRQVFDLYSMNADNQVTTKRIFDDIDLKPLQYIPDYNLENELPEYNYKSRTGFFRFELITPPFGFAHDDFIDIYTTIVTANAQPASRMPGSKKVMLPVPKQPIAPNIARISLDYKASSKISFNTPETKENNKQAKIKYFHLHPFGITEAFTKGQMYENTMFPQYNNEGYLYLGLEEVKAPQVVSMLFHMRQSNKLEALNFPKIQWSYLADNIWLDFEKEDVFLDSTKGFTTSGIVNLRLPRAISDDNQLMPPGKFWVRASAKDNTDVLSSIIGVFTQATTATYVENPEKTDHPISIPAFSLIDFQTPITEIESIAQPFTSYNARPKETDKQFYARVSERLRHKNRAISLWDYEHIVLEEFSQLYQVKCIGHIGHEEYIEQGKALIIIIPKIQPKNNFYHPTVDFDTLKVIKKHLEKIASPFVEIEVRNPIYEQLKINCKIMFKDGYNNGKYLKLLHDEILSFICPWFRGKEVDLQLGGGIPKEDILKFIEGRSYIHFVTKFSINQIIMVKDGEYQMKDTVRNPEASKILKATLPWSVLVPADKHNFEYLDKEKYEAPEASSVANMSLGTDFVILGADDVAEPQKELPPPIHNEDEDDNYYFFSIEI